MFLLALVECYEYFQVQVVEQILLDSDFGTSLLNFSLDIDFTALPCEKVHVIFEDSLKKNSKDLTSSLTLNNIPAGCNVVGFVPISKDSGSLSVAFLHQNSPEAKEVFQHLGDLFKFNSSHVINSLSFGEYFPGMDNPLDGITFSSKQESSTSRILYQIKVVPTVYRNIDGSVIQSNQFSVSQYVKTFNQRAFSASAFSAGLIHIPGIYIQYDFAPILIEKTEVKKTLPQLLTRLFALLGGTYAFAGLVDAFIYHSLRVKKID